MTVSKTNRTCSGVLHRYVQAYMESLLHSSVTQAPALFQRNVRAAGTLDVR
jgi:hypothetical protein